MKNLGMIDDDTKHISHANVNAVSVKHVLGILPYWLAAYAGKFTEIQLRVPIERKGKELSLEEVEFYSLEPKTSIIEEVEFE